MSSRPNHLRNNQTKSLALFAPLCFHSHSMTSTADHKHTSSRVRGSTTTSQTMDRVSRASRHAFAQAVEEGDRELQSPRVWPLRSSAITGGQTTGKTSPERQPTRMKRLSARTECSGIFLKWHLCIYLLQSWATYLLYKYFDFGPNFRALQAKSDHNFNLNTQHKSLFSKFRTFPLLLENIIA